MSVVDVRDVAIAHVEAMVRPEANGQRFILDGDDDNTSANSVIRQVPTSSLSPFSGPSSLPPSSLVASN